MTFGRVLIFGIGSLALAASAAGVFAAWILLSETGSTWVVGRLLQARAPWVSVGELRGSLWHGLSAADVAVVVGGDETRIETVALNLDFSEILSGTVELDAFNLATVNYTRGDDRVSRDPLRPPNLPLRFVVRDGSIERLVVTRGGETTTLGPISFSLEAEGNELRIEPLSISGPGLSLTGNATLEFGGSIAAFGGLSWDYDREELTAAGRADFSGAWPTFDVRHTLSSPVTAVANGTVQLGRASRADLTWRWTDLSWPGRERVVSPEGALQVVGWLNDYAYEASGDLIIDGLEAAFEATGSGTLSALDVRELSVDGAGGNVMASGELRFRPLAWTFDIAARDLDPGARFPEWPGTLALDGTLRGGDEPTLRVTLAATEITGMLRGQPLSAAGDVAFEPPNRWLLDGVEIDVRGNRISLNGEYGETLSLEVAVDAPAVDMLWPEAAGALAARGRLSGSVQAPALNGSLEAQDLAYGEYRVESLSVSGGLATADDVPVALDLDARGIVWRDVVIQSLTGMISGSSAAHSAALGFESIHGSGEMRAEGTWSDDRWDGIVTTMTLTQPSLGTWDLAEPTQAAFGRDQLNVESACLRQATSSLCGLARLGTGNDRIELRLSGFELANLNVLLPADLSLAGVYDANVYLDNPLNRPTGGLSLSGASTMITVREADAPPIQFPIEEVEIDANLIEDGNLMLQASIIGSAGASFSVESEVIELWAAEPGIRGEINASWSDLGVFALLSPDVGEVSGTANLDLALSGRLRSPDIRGEARWVDGGVAIPRWGFLAEGVEVRATSPDGQRVQLQGSGRVGNGSLDVDGTVDLDPALGWPTQLTVRGDGLQAVRLPDAQITMSTDFEVLAALPTIEVTGSVTIPRARLELEEIPAQAASPSSDTVVHGSDRPEPEHPLNMHAVIEVELGNDVRYSGAGLDVALSGDMDVVYDSGRNAVATGTVTLMGEYSAYGQTLQLNEGQLLFSGPINNPALDVRATREIEATTVGVQLGGTLIVPTTRIFSEPAMSEADALSYLLLGRPLSGTGDQETATLESAAVSMGLRQALPVIQRVGQSLGLDEFSVQSTAADTGELMAGKQISPRLYMRYSYGLFNRIGGLLLRFSLNDRLSLETRSGDYRSMDLVYTVEQGRRR